MLKSVLAAAILISATMSAQASVITFNGLAGTNLPTYSERHQAMTTQWGTYAPLTRFMAGGNFTLEGLTFWAPGDNRGMYIVGSEYVKDGGPSIYAGNGTDLSVARDFFIITTGASFTLNQLDLSGWAIGSGGRTTPVTITGAKFDGQSVTKSVTLSGNNSATANDLTTVSFSDFDNLSYFRIHSEHGWELALDNIHINEPIPAVVPEPGSLAIIGLGLAGLMLRRRKS